MNLFIFTIIICIFIYYIINNKKERFENSNSVLKDIRVYISFTTIPSRIAYIDEMLKSVDIPEVYEIHLNLQSEFEYPKKEIKRLKNITSKLKIYKVDEKLLLMSKIVPTMERLLGTNSLVISVDDDMEYSKNYIKEFINNYNPLAKEIYGGYLHKLEPEEYINCEIKHVLPGCFGIMYPMKIITKKIIDDLKKSGKLSTSCYKHDDIAISSILHKHNINMKQIISLSIYSKELNYSNVNAAKSFEHPFEYKNSYHYNSSLCCTAINKYL